MREFRLVPLGALVVALVTSPSACTRTERRIGVGDVVSVDSRGAAVTIRHDAMPGLLGAATTRFTADSAALLASVRVGSRVRFEVTQKRGGLLLTSIRLLSEGNPGIHDHTPHHGGVVAMAGMIHIETRADPSGAVSVYLTDRWRRPLPVEGVEGTVTMRTPQGKRTLPLRVEEDVLRAEGPPLPGREVNAQVLLDYGQQSVDVHFVLPLGSSSPGAVGVPAQGCVPSSSAGGKRRHPRCVTTFTSPVASLVAAPDGSSMLVAVVGSGVTAWRLPSGEFVRGFAPPPPVEVPVDEPPHVEAANALAIDPAGTTAIAAYEGRLIRYAVDSGEMLGAWAGPGGVIREVRWSPDGTQILLSAFYDRSAHLLDAQTGEVAGRFEVEREAAGVAFAAHERWVAVGSEAGPISVFNRRSGERIARLSPSPRPARAIEFVGTFLLAAGDDGALHVWDGGAADSERRSPAAAPIHFLASSPDASRAASAGLGGTIRIHELPSARVVETLAWHDAQISGLAWSGATLVAPHTNGRIALWDF